MLRLRSSFLMLSTRSLNQSEQEDMNMKRIFQKYIISLREVQQAAYAVAQDTLDDVKAAMKIDYFNDAELIKVQSEKYSRTE